MQICNDVQQMFNNFVLIRLLEICANKTKLGKNNLIKKHTVIMLSKAKGFSPASSDPIANPSLIDK